MYLAAVAPAGRYVQISRKKQQNCCINTENPKILLSLNSIKKLSYKAKAWEYHGYY